MRRRNICIKAVLWIVAIILFAANIGLIIYKAKSMWYFRYSPQDIYLITGRSYLLFYFNRKIELEYTDV